MFIRHILSATIASIALGAPMVSFAAQAASDAAISTQTPALASATEAVTMPASPSAVNADTLVARGQYLATAADCAACHTATAGKPFAGGVVIDTPIGQIVSTNITSSKVAGIGGYTLAQFSNALRHGVRADGANLYPAMPYTAYTKITDADIAALYAYFNTAVPAVDAAPSRKTALPFPFNVRLSMAFWNRLFLDTKPFSPVSDKSVEWNRGAYLAEALGHCQTCHTPRNFLMAEQSGAALSGSSLGTWYAPNITSDKATGIGSWTEEDIYSYLKFGHAAVGSQAGGPMLEAIDKSFSHLNDADLHAMATWVASVPAVKSGNVDKATLTSKPIANDFALANNVGATIYSDSCAACHQATGKGVRGLPALVGNAAFARPVADNVVLAILEGVTPASGQNMAGFADKLTDEQIASLTNFLFSQFGSAQVQTTAAHVAELRAGGAKSPLLMLSRVGMALGALVVIALIAFGVVRRKTSRRGVGM